MPVEQVATYQNTFMRILVVKNKKANRAYARAIDELLEEIGKRVGYPVAHNNGLTQAYNDNPNLITFTTLAASSSIERVIQQWKLSAFTKKHHYNLVIQHAEQYIKHKKTPQLLIADDVDRLPPVKKVSFSKIFLLTFSQATRQAIIEKGFTNIIHVVPFVAAPTFTPISWSLQQQVKMDYTEGREYFYSATNFQSLDDVLSLLKAFSGFKKWQRSGMKLVLTGRLHVPEKEWTEKLSTYKFRDDIMLYHHLPEEEKRKLLAGAYACIHLPYADYDLLPLVQAVQCHTPVISFELPATKEYAGDAVLCAPRGDYDSLAQLLIRMYKDETGRNKMIASCAQYASSLSTDTGIQALHAIVS